MRIFTFYGDTSQSSAVVTSAMMYASTGTEQGLSRAAAP